MNDFETAREHDEYHEHHHREYDEQHAHHYHEHDDQHVHHHHHASDGTHRHHKDRACSPRRKRRIVGKILFALLCVVAVAIMAACLWVAIYGLY